MHHEAQTINKKTKEQKKRRRKRSGNNVKGITKKNSSYTYQLLRSMSAVHPVSDGLPPAPRPVVYRWFPSWRLLTSSLLCLCFASVHMMNSNMGMAVVCMVNSSEFVDENQTIPEEGAAPRLRWTSDQE
ncbi:hypothetical protein TELCIR_12479, partial [Teladorsagia circumcincta]